MKKQSFENLKKFFEKVKSVGFIERLFSWKNIVFISYDAYEEFKSVDKKLDSVNEDLEEANKKIGLLENDEKNLKESKTELQSDKKSLEKEKNELIEKVVGFEKTYEKNKEEHDTRVANLQDAKKSFDEERIRIRQEKEEKDEKLRERMKKQWKEHEDKVNQFIKKICSRNSIDYVDKVPFKGNPDNTIKICDEYIIFDAKSPQSEDLSNFPKYMKDQAESVQKYAKNKNVKKAIFLVIPTNTADSINEKHFNQVDYNVYVVTLDALEPIILSLKKIEDYEFAEQLSPEDRQNICRVIGKFAHATKRRIQVDHFFANKFFEILKDCDELPIDILDGAVEAERSGALNPPQERKGKTSDLDLDHLKKIDKQIKKDAEAKDIDTKSKIGAAIEKTPLYKEDE